MYRGEDSRARYELTDVVDARFEAPSAQRLRELRYGTLADIDRRADVCRQPSRAVNDRGLCAKDVPSNPQALQRRVERGEKLNDG
jgi:hypothetical protein